MARLSAALLALAVLAVVPMAYAQLPPTAASPVVTLKVDMPVGPETIALGASSNVSLTVTFGVSNVVCPTASLPASASPGQATVKLSVKDAPGPLPGIASTVTPAQVVFNLTQPQYASPGFSGTQKATLSLSVAKTVMASHDHALNVSATFDGTIANCQAAGGSIPSAVAFANHMIKTGPANGPGVVNGTSIPTSTATKKSPAAGLSLLVLLGAIAVGLRRRN